jgi:membrane protein implicated in regulation of membrane protease activity
MALHRTTLLPVAVVAWVGGAGLALGVVPWQVAVAGVAFAVPVAILLERYLAANPPDEIAALEGRAREGTITVAIPTRGLGKVLFVAQGKRLSRPARTSDGRALPAGRPVLIVSLRRHVAVVEPLPVL